MPNFVNSILLSERLNKGGIQFFYNIHVPIIKYKYVCVFMKSLFPEKYHRYIYIFALIILVIGLPLSKFLMSLSQIILACNWLLEGNIKNKVKTFWSNKVALLVSSLLLLHFIGLIHTSDFTYAFKDIRIKAPLFILPLIISTSPPLSKKIFENILKILTAAIISGTFVSTLILMDIIHRPVIDTRDISIYISHIRFSLLICVAVFISSYFIFKSITLLSKITWSLVLLWLLSFLIIMESLTGLAALFVTTLILIIYSVFKPGYSFLTKPGLNIAGKPILNAVEASKKRGIKYSALLFVVGALSLSFYYVNSIANEIKPKENVDFNTLDTHTSQGNVYEHNIQSKVRENGHLVWLYYSTDELKESWNKRSAVAVDGKDLKGNIICYTLIRFLTSKGFRKDANAVNLLTDDEIKAVERGVTNVNYQNISSLRGRIYETLWEIDLYSKTGQLNGHSLTQRFEYWKAALDIIKNNLFFGVGTGDVPKVFEQEYIKMNSSLSQNWRLRSHNQYLSIAVAFGIIGLLWFIATLAAPFLINTKKISYLYITFFIIAIISFFTEDTLETQAGVTFFAFLNSYFLFAKESDPEVYPVEPSLP